MAELDLFLYYFFSLRMDAEALPPTQIGPISSLPQNFPKEVGELNGRKRARRPVAHRARLPVNVHELYLSMREGGKNSRTRKVAKSLGFHVSLAKQP